VGIIEGALIGGAVGAVIGLIIWLIKGKKDKANIKKIEKSKKDTEVNKSIFRDHD